MPIVPAICPNCKGTVTVDNDSRAAICDFCGTPFVVEDAITNYNYNIEHMTVQDSNSAASMIRNGENSMKIAKWGEAIEYFDTATKIDVGNPEAWFGYVRATTHNFSDVIYSQTLYEKTKEALSHAITFAGSSKRISYRTQWDSWRNTSTAKLKKDKAEAESNIEFLKTSLEIAQASYSEVAGKAAELNSQSYSASVYKISHGETFWQGASFALFSLAVIVGIPGGLWFLGEGMNPLLVVAGFLAIGGFLSSLMDSSVNSYIENDAQRIKQESAKAQKTLQSESKKLKAAEKAYEEAAYKIKMADELVPLYEKF